LNKVDRPRGSKIEKTIRSFIRFSEGIKLVDAETKRNFQMVLSQEASAYKEIPFATWDGILVMTNLFILADESNWMT
jgi:hypothetical protein